MAGRKLDIETYNQIRPHQGLFNFTPAHVHQLVRAVEDPDEPIPEIARPILQMLIETLHRLANRVKIANGVSNRDMLRRI